MVRIGAPTKEEIVAHPREYALYTELPGLSSGDVSTKELEEYVKKYGTGAGTLKGDSVSFADLAKALAKSGPKVQGQGNTLGWAAHNDTGHLSPCKFDLRPVGDDDVFITIAYCGICHSDLHQIKNEWGNATYPMVPGHEIIGIVTAVGKNAAAHFSLGDRAGVGCFVYSCRECRECEIDTDQYCSRCVMTYNGRDWRHDNSVTKGGYATGIVVDHRYVLKVPKNLDMAAAAPLLCAGITTYSPMQYYGLNKPGMRLGVVGLGGLGHIAVRLAKAMGMHVTVISTSSRKEKEAREVLGADHFIISKDEKQMQDSVRSLDGILDTISAQHEISQLLPLLKINGKLVLLGVPPEPHTFSASNVLFSRLTIGGSLIGGIKETQEMLDFCGEKGIVCMTETISADYLNTAMDRLVKNDVHYRFVVDIQGSMLKEA